MSIRIIIRKCISVQSLADAFSAREQYILLFMQVKWWMILDVYKS